MKRSDTTPAYTAPRFGDCPVTGGLEALFSALNDEIIALIRSLPRPLRTDGLLFLMRYTGNSLGEPPAFFRKYYVPSWSILHWIPDCYGRPPELTDARYHDALRAHAMAFLLHSLDDHLCDGEIPVNHLTLLLRSQAWRFMTDSHNALAGAFPFIEAIAPACIDRYYGAITTTAEPVGLDGYCSRFIDQMYTCFIIPRSLALICGMEKDHTERIITAYGSFGLAWRLLDDIQDLADDLLRGERNAVYYALPDALQKQWDGMASKGNTKTGIQRFMENAAREGTVETVTTRICAELDRAAATASGLGMAVYAAELRILAAPLANIPGGFNEH